ncbi:MAG TPA: PEP-CTERM sorting domain-containing protein [Pyrinomonadaceae bacterium]|nr:PEP-CTERM sorting domain-containing protein [Pyrinomonadaceae bacterium]
MPRKLSTALASLALLLLFAIGAQADPLVITGGTAIINTAGSGRFNFNLTAPGFAATGYSNSADLTTIYGDADHHFGSITVNGITQTGKYFQITQLDFTLAPFTRPPGCCNFFGPELHPGVDTIIIDTAFTMSGNLVFGPNYCIFCSENYFPTFSTLITGSGFAQITYLRIQGTTSFFASGVVYTFGATEPIPEPATLVLLGTGLAGVMVKARRRRRKL